MGLFGKLFGKKKDMKMDSMGDMNTSCPNCSSQMKMTMVDNNMVNLCFNCGNFFMDQNAFQNLVGQDVGKETHKSEKDKKVNCPSCKMAMKATEVQGEEVEVCSHCKKVHTDRDSLIHIHEKLDEKEDEPDGKDEKVVEEKMEEKVSDVEKTLLGFVFKMDNERNDQLVRGGQLSSEMMVNSLFVIYRNGLLISSYSKDEGGVDKDLVGGMIVAITDFVRTSFESFGKGEPLQSIRFIEKEIAFEHGTYLILAMELEGMLDRVSRDDISKKLKEIEAEHENELEAWKGDMSDLNEIIIKFKELLVPVG